MRAAADRQPSANASSFTKTALVEAPLAVQAAKISPQAGEHFLETLQEGCLGCPRCVGAFVQALDSHFYEADKNANTTDDAYNKPNGYLYWDSSGANKTAHQDFLAFCRTPAVDLIPRTKEVELLGHAFQFPTLRELFGGAFPRVDYLKGLFGDALLAYGDGGGARPSRAASAATPRTGLASTRATA